MGNCDGGGREHVDFSRTAFIRGSLLLLETVVAVAVGVEIH